MSSRRSSLKQLGGELGEILSPNGPRMVAGSQLPLVVHAFAFERGNKLFIALAESVVLAAADPQQLELGVRRSWIGKDRALKALAASSTALAEPPPSPVPRGTETSRFHPLEFLVKPPDWDGAVCFEHQPAMEKR